jgi:GntR family transcriptional repressor for pyruvate dehydrogenase complex
MAAEKKPSIVPVQRLKLADAVAAQLARLISQGEYDLAGRLPAERVLADQFGVGRSSMREALRSVEAEGLVRIEHGVGVSVVDKASREAKDSPLLMPGNFTVPEFFEVRVPLERDAAGLAARRVGPSDAKELKRILALSADAAISDDEFIELDAQLHRTVIKTAKNGLLLDVMGRLEPLFLTYSHHVIALPGRRATAHTGHVRIVEAICERRVRDARSAAVSHIRAVEADLSAHLHPADDHR